MDLQKKKKKKLNYFLTKLAPSTIFLPIPAYNDSILLVAQVTNYGIIHDSYLSLTQPVSSGNHISSTLKIYSGSFHFSGPPTATALIVTTIISQLKHFKTLYWSSSFSLAPRGYFRHGSHNNSFQIVSQSLLFLCSKPSMMPHFTED